MSEEIKNEKIENGAQQEEKEQHEEGKEQHQDDAFVPQSKVDEIVKKRLERERKKYADYDELKAKLAEFEKAEEERKKAEMSELERLQSELAELQKKAQEAEEVKNKTLESANQRLIKAEFKLIAKEMGVRKEAIDDAFVLADLSGVEVDDDGNVQGVKEALESLKKSKAYLFGGQNYADPTPGQHETKREGTQEQAKRKLQELAEKAKRSGKIEDKIAYVQLKKELGL
jgi:Phage minor structural protein GP20